MPLHPWSTPRRRAMPRPPACRGRHAGPPRSPLPARRTVARSPRVDSVATATPVCDRRRRSGGGRTARWYREGLEWTRPASDLWRRNDSGEHSAGDPSVDNQRLAVDPPGLVGREEQHRIGDVAWVGVPAGELLDAVEVVLAHGFFEVGKDGGLDRSRE